MKTLAEFIEETSPPRFCRMCDRKIKKPARADKQFCSNSCRVKFWRRHNAS